MSKTQCFVGGMNCIAREALRFFFLEYLGRNIFEDR